MSLTTILSLIFAIGVLGNPVHHDGLVDLGYAKHVPTFVNFTSSGHKVSIYQNIRFANSPTGDLRFRRPNTDLPVVDEVQDGSAPWGSRDCIASAPGYVPFPQINGTAWGHEDCLFLDVYVPEGVSPGDDVPVLHFFFGGAYGFGSKGTLFSPMGLFEHMFNEGGEKFIFVVNNYRLGMPGFTYAEDEDMDANVGLFDCLAAAEWTTNSIHKFGGGGQRVTAIGQSSGAGMLFYMTTLFGGEEKLPFQQIFVSSPAVPPRRNTTQRQKQLFDLVLETANCTSLACLRSAPEETLLAVNDQLINHTPTTSGGGLLGPVLGFGPAPDGTALPDLPLAQFRRGALHRGLGRLAVGSMAAEGMGLSSDADMPAYFPVMVRQVLPAASNATVQRLLERYYDEGQPERLAWDWTTDVIFACNVLNLARALPETTRRYVMSTPPATHGQDLMHYFYVDPESTPVSNVALARDFQTKLLRFVRGEEMEDWPVYGAEQRMVNITADAFEQMEVSPDMEARCEEINELVLDPANGA